MQAGEASGVGEQRDGVGGDREADAARLVGAPVEPEAAVLAGRQRPRGDRLRIGEAQARERERVGLPPARERDEDVVQRRPQAAGEFQLLGPPALPATPSRAPQRSSESGSSRASVAEISTSPSVQSTLFAKSSDSVPPCNLIVSGVYVTT